MWENKLTDFIPSISESGSGEVTLTTLFYDFHISALCLINT